MCSVIVTVAVLLAAPDPSAGHEPPDVGHMALIATTPPPFTDRAELEAALAAVERGGDVEAFWSRVKAVGLPLIFGDHVVLLHRSDAEAVEWRSDLTDWGGGALAAGRRVGDTDLWVYQLDLKPGARLDYKIVELRARWLVDPLNPQQQLGGYGPNSEIRMPAFVPPASVVRRAGVPAGTLGPVEVIRSAKLGADVVVRVYTPAKRADAPRKLPILYVTDGSDYWNDDMGALVTTLDNLIADRRIPPLVAVFVDAWDEKRTQNRREGWFVPQPSTGSRDTPWTTCPFCDFLVDELRPRVESRFSIDPTRRAIMGTSLGGLNAAYLGLRNPDVFPLLVMQSPAVGWQPWIPAGYSKAKTLPRRAVIDPGAYEARFLPGAQLLRDALTARQVPLWYAEALDGHSWGHWRATAAPALEFVFAER